VPTNTTNQGIPYPTKEDSPGDLAEYIQDVAVALEKKAVMVFTSAADRDSRMVGANSPTTGMVCILQDSMKMLKYNGTAWVNVFPTITVSTSSPTGGENGDIWLKI
jgi:hypothetical protein